MERYFYYGEERTVNEVKLTDKQKRFCEEYLVDLNATQAAIRAGYKHSDVGRRLVTKSHVSDYIEKLKKQQSKRTEITADRVLEAIAEIGFGEFKAKDRLKALELLGKHLGLFTASADNSPALEKLDEVLGKIESNF